MPVRLCADGGKEVEGFGPGASVEHVSSFNLSILNFLLQKIEEDFVASYGLLVSRRKNCEKGFRTRVRNDERARGDKSVESAFGNHSTACDGDYRADCRRWNLG